MTMKTSAKKKPADKKPADRKPVTPTDEPVYEVPRDRRHWPT